MKKIEAIIKPYKLEEVRDALGELGVTGMTVTEVRGFGRQQGPAELFRGREYTSGFMPKIRIEVVVMDQAAESTVAAVVRSAGLNRRFAFAPRKPERTQSKQEENKNIWQTQKHQISRLAGEEVLPPPKLPWA